MIAAFRRLLDILSPLRPTDLSNLDLADGLRDPEADLNFYLARVAGQMRIDGRFAGWDHLHSVGGQA